MSFETPGPQVEEDSFAASTPIGPIPMANLIAKFPGTGRETVIVAGHYDTKRFDDFRFVGANDGGSSAALLVGAGSRPERSKARVELLAGLL